MKITAHLLDKFYHPPIETGAYCQWAFKPVKENRLTPTITLNFNAYSRSFRARRNWEDVEDVQAVELLKERLPPEAIVECVRAAIDSDDIPF
ncbi:MAG TPA: hypothetical protein VK181_04405 [Rhizobium sp.]|nr:hypothetical protein [Rhizobium sp.]